MSFASLGLSAPLLKAVQDQGFETPSPIQEQAIPAALSGRDVMAAAQTGTGKTAGFTLPLLEKLAQGKPARSGHVRALILTPTRELAAQVSDSVVSCGRHLRLSSAVVFGGTPIRPQITRLRRGTDILVATPGRLLDLYQQNAMRFDRLEVLVMDEADRMLDMGFIHDIRRIIGLLPESRQNLMFSATFSDAVRKLARSLVKDPLEIAVEPKQVTTDAVEQWVTPVDRKQKSALLSRLINDNQWDQVLVFTRTRHGADRLAEFLDDEGIKAEAIHGNKTQGMRRRTLNGFKKGKVRILVATDIAARGIDIQDLPQVVNFDLPDQPEDYVHRIGRTGRGGATGQAMSLVSADEFRQLSAIERLIRQTLPRRPVEGFEPTRAIPKAGPKGDKRNTRGRKRPGGSGGGQRAQGERRRQRLGNSNGGGQQQKSRRTG